jgi:outer membrane protein insertion porin family
MLCKFYQNSRRIKPTLFLGLILLSLNLSAQSTQYRIKSLRIEGNVEADSSLILINSGLIKGSYIQGDKIQKAIQNLWSLKLFSNIQIYAEGSISSDLKLVIHVDEYPRLEGWIVEGNKKLKKKDIDQEIGFYKGMVFSPFKSYKARKKLVEKYKDEGYLLASVEIDTVHTKTNRVVAEINIKEGKKVQVERIRVLGSKILKPKDLKKAFKEIKEDRWWRGADFDRKKYEKDLQNLIDYCRKEGFRDAEVVKDSLYYSQDKTDLFIDVYINEGRQYYFGDITFEGNKIFDDNKLLDVLLFQKGDIYNLEKYDKSIRENIQNLYYNQGYLFANIQPREIPAGDDSVDINVKINEGEVVRIKEIKITGNTKTNEKVIRRELKIYPGDKFNRDKLERSVRDVWILNYFSNVVPDVKLIPNDDKFVNLQIDIEEKSTETANMSAGYSQRDGMIGSVGVSLNNFSLRHPFSGGDGQRLAFDWSFGRYYRSISLGFTEPWMFGTPTLAGFSVFDTRSGGGFYGRDLREQGITLQLGRRFRWPDNYFSGNWILRIAQTEVFNVTDPELELYYTRINASTSQISLTQIIQRDSRNRPEFPTQGSVYSLATELSGGPLQGEEDFIKNTLSVEWFMPVKFGFVLYLNNKFGLIEGLHKDAFINWRELFYMGGSGLGFSEGLRGYDDGTIGPVTSDGSPIGGKSMAKFSSELRFPIAPNPTIYGLFFMEAGNVWEDFPQTDLQDLKRSAGIGVRLFMPMIGIIGVDFGYGYDHLDSFGIRKGQWKIHFQYGRF